MNLVNFSKFSDAYRAKLLESVTANPGQYMGVPKDASLIPPYVDGLANRMLTTIQTKGIGAVSLSNTFKNAAMSLGIKPTYKGINEYLNA
jgi:nucleoside permease NupC